MTVSSHCISIRITSEPKTMENFTFYHLLSNFSPKKSVIKLILPPTVCVCTQFPTNVGNYPSFNTVRIYKILFPIENSFNVI